MKLDLGKIADYDIAMGLAGPPLTAVTGRKELCMPTWDYIFSARIQAVCGCGDFAWKRTELLSGEIVSEAMAELRSALSDPCVGVIASVLHTWAAHTRAALEALPELSYLHAVIEALLYVTMAARDTVVYHPDGPSNALWVELRLADVEEALSNARVYERLRGLRGVEDVVSSDG